MGGQQDARLHEALVALTPRQRAALLRVLTRSPTTRAETIGDVFARPEARHVAELLIDLEEDDFVRAQVVEALESLRDGEEEG